MILRYYDRYKIKFRTTMPVENAAVLDGLIDRQLDLIVANFREQDDGPE